MSGGAFTVGSLSSSVGSLSASANAIVQVNSVSGEQNLSLTADSTSSLEIGDSRNAAKGAVTFDTGAAIVEAGTITAPGIVDDDPITIRSGQSLTLDGTSRGLSGGGMITISPGSTTYDRRRRVDPASQNTIAFCGRRRELEIGGVDLKADSFNTFVPSIVGFDSSDTIFFKGTVTSAIFTPAGPTQGTLTLNNGSDLVATLNVTVSSDPTDGNGYRFSTLAVQGGTAINYLGASPSGAPASNPSPPAERFVWTESGAGLWSAATNWGTVTGNLSSPSYQQADRPPESVDDVTIGAAPSPGVHIVTGDGNARYLTIADETLLIGKFQVDDLTVTNHSLVLQTGSYANVDAAVSARGAGLTLDGGTITAMSFDGGYNSSIPDQYVISNRGELSVSGSLTAYQAGFEVSGKGTLSAGTVNAAAPPGGSGNSRFSIDSGQFSVSGKVTSWGDSIAASQGGQIEFGDLQTGAGSQGGVSLSADNTSSVEIGWSGGKATTPAGAITIDKNASVTEWGSFSAPTIDDEGTITVADGETLSITGALSGGGSIEVRPDATLALNGELSLAGTIKLDAGATLTVDSASPASATTIAFTQDGWTSTSGAGEGIDF